MNPRARSLTRLQALSTEDLRAMYIAHDRNAYQMAKTLNVRLNGLTRCLAARGVRPRGTRAERKLHLTRAELHAGYKRHNRNITAFARAEGVSTTCMASHLKRASVRLRRIGLKGLTDVQVMAIYHGASNAKAACKKAGTTPCTLRKEMRRRGLPMQRASLRHISDAVLRHLYNELRSARKVAEYLGHPYDTVTRHYQRRGISLCQGRQEMTWTKAIFMVLYVERKHSLKEIAEAWETDPSHVWITLRRWKIPTRSRREGQLLLAQYGNRVVDRDEFLGKGSTARYDPANVSWDAESVE